LHVTLGPSGPHEPLMHDWPAGQSAAVAQLDAPVDGAQVPFWQVKLAP
jgi:hypothetical protein